MIAGEPAAMLAVSVCDAHGRSICGVPAQWAREGVTVCEWMRRKAAWHAAN
jgi:hypothetical protein